MADEAKRRSDRDQPPLLIIGGFYPLLTPMPLGKARRFFERHGRRVHILPHGIRSMRDIRLRAKCAAEMIGDILSETGCDRLDILGFSMGGLAGLYAIQRSGLAGQVRTFLTYGSPYQGVSVSLAALATVYYAKAARQLLPESDFLRELRAGGLPPGPRYISVSGLNDWLCQPEEAWLSGARHAYLESSHLDFLIKGEIYRQLEVFLLEPPG